MSALVFTRCCCSHCCCCCWWWFLFFSVHLARCACFTFCKLLACGFLIIFSPFSTYTHIILQILHIFPANLFQIMMIIVRTIFIYVYGYFFLAKILFQLALLYDVWLTISVRRITIEREMKMEMKIKKERESDNTKQIFLAIIFICLVSEKQHKESKIFKLQSLFRFQCLFSGSEIHQGDCIQNWYHIFLAYCCAALLNIAF